MPAPENKISRSAPKTENLTKPLPPLPAFHSADGSVDLAGCCHAVKRTKDTLDAVNIPDIQAELSELRRNHAMLARTLGTMLAQLQDIKGERHCLSG